MAARLVPENQRASPSPLWREGKLVLTTAPRSLDRGDGNTRGFTPPEPDGRLAGTGARTVSIGPLTPPNDRLTAPLAIPDNDLWLTKS